MNYSKLGFCFFLLLISLNIETTFAQNIEEYLKGTEALTKGDTSKAAGYFESSTKRNKDAESYFELAKINNNINTLNSLLKARLLILAAIKKDKTNLEYRYLYAQLLKKLFRVNFFDKDGLDRAKDEYSKILEINSRSSHAYYELAKLIERDFYEFYTSEIVELNYNKSKSNFYKGDKLKEDWNNYINSLFESGSYASLKMEKLTDKYLIDAERYFNLAFKYDTLNSDAVLRAAMMLAFSKEYEKSLDILKPVYNKFRENVNINLTMAFCYFRLKDNSEANKYFNTAFTKMGEKKRFEYKVESVLEILEPDFKERIINLDKVTLKKTIEQYWDIKDPLNLTNENERLLEHYARVFYADNFLSDYDPYIHFREEIKTSGWQTERGIALVRFGEPLERRKLRATKDDSSKTDYWDYGDFKLAFNETSHRKKYRLGDLGTGHYYADSKFIYDDVIKKTPERFNPNFEGPIFNVPYNAVQFKNLNDKLSLTDFYLNYALTTNEGEIRNNKLFYNHMFGIFFKDRNFSKIYEVKDSLKYLDMLNEIKIAEADYIVNSVSLSVKPAESNLAFEIFREKDKGVSSYHGKIIVKDFSSNNLLLSDIVLANKINFDDENTGTIQRGNYKILPNPTRTFNKENKPFIYYEVYNLKKGENNLTSFEQEITIREVEEENDLGNILNSFLDVIGFDSKGNEITLSSNYSTIETDTQIYLQLDLSSYDPGEYLITVSIKDKITGEETNNEVKINWL